MIRRFLWGVCRSGYQYIAKPILFKLSPDNVHASMTHFASVVSRIGALRWFVHLIFVRRDDQRLIQTYHGIEFKSPIGLSAGFDKNGEIIPAIAALGFGFGEVGSVTARRCMGNPGAWFYRLPRSQSTVINAGLANDGSRTIIDRLNGYQENATKGFPVFLSVAKTNDQKVVSITDGIDDYITTIKRAQKSTKIQVLEINISCPNVYGGEPFTTPGRLKKLLDAIDEVKPSQPIFIKMPIDLEWTKFSALLEVIVAHDVAGVTIANLMKNRNKIKLLDPLPDTVKGNLSGRATWDTSNQLIRQTYLKYGNRLTIIGVGGIFSAEDAYTKIKLGANLVELITGMLFTGPQLAAEISYDLSKLLARDGYTHISQAIGADAKKS